MWKSHEVTWEERVFRVLTGSGVSFACCVELLSCVYYEDGIIQFVLCISLSLCVRQEGPLKDSGFAPF